MKQAIAEVISNERLLGELERRDAGTFRHPEARNTLGAWLMWLRCPEIAREAKPGQFVMVRCGEHVLPRPFSIHQVNDEGDMALFFAVWEGGKGTGWLSQRQNGDTVELFGPLGNGFSIHPASNKLLLVAGGVGIAPLYFLAQQAHKKGLSVTLLIGASGEYKPSGTPNPPQHYPKELLPRGIEAKTITSSPDGREGMVIDLLTPEIIDGADQIFACGPIPMYRTMAAHQQQLLKGKPAQVSLEIRMGCGHGVCYGCTLKTREGLRKVCEDGPVFDLDDILWDELSRF